MVYWGLQYLGITHPSKHYATVEKYSFMLDIGQKIGV